jgi:hypothetical protein
MGHVNSGEYCIVTDIVYTEQNASIQSCENVLLSHTQTLMFTCSSQCDILEH